MICALRSSFFRLFRTGLFAKIILFSLLIGAVVIFNYCSHDLLMYVLRRPRYLDNTFIIGCILKLVYVIPFVSAVFCMMYTGSDISFRAINNRITTGISRVHIYIADLAVSVLSTLVSVAVMSLLFYVFAKTIPEKENVKINGYIAGLLFSVALICVAFAAVYTLMQFFLGNKFLGLVISLLIIPCLALSTEAVERKLQEPYRNSYVNEETGMSYWDLNPNYAGGTERKLLTLYYNTSPYSFGFASEDKDYPEETAAAGVIVLLSTAAGVISIRKKEYP